MLSVIIATYNNERPLVRTLSALVSAAATGVVREVIITDGGSSDATRDVADIAGCDIADDGGPLAQRLAAAAAKARSDWLMFLRPGAIPDSGWAEEFTQFVQRMDLQDDSAVNAAAFRRSNLFSPSRSALADALSMLGAALFSRVDTAQGLIIAKRHYEALGGHRATSDTEGDLLRQVGRRLILLRSGAAFTTD